MTGAASNTKKRMVPVLIGASEVLVAHREMRTSYQTNRSIKTWATYFLLKSLSIPSVIKTWTNQKDNLLDYCRMTERSFYTRLQELKRLGLITISKNYCIHLVSYEKAAQILGIPFTGTIKIEYHAKTEGKQIFQYHLVLDEIRCNQNKQIEAISYKANKNPQLRETLEAVMIQYGADGYRLDDERYFQEHLLRIQLALFKTGSDSWSLISELRGDKNRSVQGIRKQYGYRSAQSVSYFKGRLLELNIAVIVKKLVESDARTRLYVPDGQGRRRDRVKYCRRTKRTVLFLCDDIIPKIKIIDTRSKKKNQATVA
jgi:hypothetical protein